MKDILKTLIGSVLGAIIIAALGLHQYKVIVASPTPAVTPAPVTHFEAKPQPEPTPIVVAAPITPISVEPQAPVPAPTPTNNTPFPELSEPVKTAEPVAKDEPTTDSQPPADSTSSWRRFGDTGSSGTASGWSAQPQQQYPPATSQEYAPQQRYVAPSYPSYGASPQYPMVVPIVPGYRYNQPRYRTPYLPSWLNRPRPQPYYRQPPIQRYYAPAAGGRRH